MQLNPASHILHSDISKDQMHNNTTHFAIQESFLKILLNAEKVNSIFSVLFGNCKFNQAIQPATFDIRHQQGLDAQQR